MINYDQAALHVLSKSEVPDNLACPSRPKQTCQNVDQLHLQVGSEGKAGTG